jgi:hypothetical protein
MHADIPGDVSCGDESSLLRHISREGDQVLRINYVLIDFENVQPESIAALEQSHYRVLIFVGATQAKLPFEVVSSIQRMGERARYIRMSGSGPNALDFHIAFYIGELASADPTASFHIISKDTGFDPLIRHLKARHISAARSPSVAAMTQIKASPKKKVASERARIIVELLRQPKSTKPRTDTTLGRHIATFFQKQKLSEAEVAAVVASMQSAGHISLADGKVVYSLPQ